MTPNYNYIYFYVGSWNNGDLTTQQFYFSSYQVTQLNIYILAVDLTNINFMSVITYWNSWWDYNFLYTTGPRSTSATIYYNQINTTGYTNLGLKSFVYLNYVYFYSPDNIVLTINSAVLDSQTVQVDCYT